ncbi:MAG: hypothetical protein V2B19_07830 [Pseudomonadota bacterium]
MKIELRKSKKTTIQVQGAAVTILNQKEEDFISLTDIAKHRESDRTDHLIQNWMQNRNTIGRVQALSDQGVSAPQGGRKPQALSGLETEFAFNTPDPACWA